jgi:hypothetical protein
LFYITEVSGSIYEVFLSSVFSFVVGLSSSISCSRTEPNNCNRLFPLSATTIVPSFVIFKPHGNFNCPGPSP